MQNQICQSKNDPWMVFVVLLIWQYTRTILCILHQYSHLNVLFVSFSGLIMIDNQLHASIYLLHIFYCIF